MMTRIRTVLLRGCALAILSASATFAQESPATEAAPQTPGLPAPEAPCEVTPGDGNAPTVAPNSEGTAARDGSLSATLDRCGGVLSPPAVGDEELVEPAPDKGVTPIIPPSAVPDDE